MSRTRRKKRRSAPCARVSKPETSKTTPRQKALLVGFGAVTVVVALLALEGILHLTGYADPAARPDPFLGFEQTQPLFRLAADASGDAVYVTCPNKETFFNHQQFTARKQPRTFRIFCLGGSSTYGRPYRWETAFPRWIELILNSSGSDRHFEVINAGGISYASYRVANLVEEILESDYDPDLLIIYCGHNEFLEKRTYGDLIDRAGALHRIRVFLERFRLVTLLRSALGGLRSSSESSGSRYIMDDEVDAILDRSAGLDYYARDDGLRDDVLRHYEIGLERMVEMAGMRGVPVVLINMVYNLKDFSPFKSVNSEGLGEAHRTQWHILYRLGCGEMEKDRPVEAADALRKAARIDPRHAELQFRIGRCFEAMGELAAAESCYLRAKDEDICALRALEGMNAAIERVATRYDAPLVDLNSRLREVTRQRTGSPILGNDLFLDHIHLTIEGHQIMALEIVECLRREGLLDTARNLDRDQLCQVFDGIEASLDADYMAQRHLNLAKVLSWAGREHEAEHHLALAAELMSDNAEVRYRVGKSLREAGHTEEARDEFVRALEIRPDYAAAHNDMGLCCLAEGDIQGAERCFRKALELRPDQAMPRVGLGRCYEARGMLDRAIAEYEKAIDLQPDYADALNNLGLAHHQAGRFAQAEQAFRRILDLYPDHAEVRVNLGSLYTDTGKHAEAEREFRKALQTKPDLHQAYGNLGLVLLTKGDRAGAVAMFEKVLEHNPGDQGAIDLLRRLGAGEGRTAAE
jgi:tetratricopeptide (TPR) repeat protein